MKIKLADVAKALGISKATVSLAVNGKPGVSEETRKLVLDYIDARQKTAMQTPLQQITTSAGSRTASLVPDSPPSDDLPETPAGNRGIIRILVINHNLKVVCNPDLDLWSGVFAAFDAECRRHGYIYSPSFLNDTDAPETRRQVIAECNLPQVSGIVLYGTEMNEKDLWLLAALRKPLVVYDYDVPGNQTDCILIDNALAVRMAADALFEKGAHNILYLASDMRSDIYNFTSRREAYFRVMHAHQRDIEKSDIIKLGLDIDENTKKAVSWLSSHPLPDAFIMENFRISVGMMNAIRHLKIRLPNQLRLIGIDEVPGYLGGGVALAQIRIPHEERAVLALRILMDRIADSGSMHIRVFTSPILVEGLSV